MDVFLLFVFALAAVVWGVQIVVWARRMRADTEAIAASLARIEARLAAKPAPIGPAVSAAPAPAAPAPSNPVNIDPFVD